MPKISDIQETPNPNAVKFILKEPVTNGIARQFDSPDKVGDDPLASALFDTGHVVSVFYMDRMVTVEKDEEGDWDEMLPQLAVPIRAAEATTTAPAAAAAGTSSEQSSIGGALGAVMSGDPRLVRINELLDEKVRPALMMDGGYLEVLGIKDNTLNIRYQGACGSCPSSLTGTLMAIEGMIRQEVDPDLEVVAV
ncbi:MAG TPA: NifU family protein [Pyrinomonadaceae bacterium]|jgi:Fe-S cluster biogenesis protein NfuA